MTERSEAAEKYEQLLQQLLRDRNLHGDLGQDVESAYVAMLDEHWRAMSQAEQDAAEAQWSVPAPGH